MKGQQNIEIETIPITNGIDSNCVLIHSRIQQEVVITNTGGIDISDIPFTLEVYDNFGFLLQTSYDTLEGVLEIDSSRNLIFTEYYTVPNHNPTYDVIVSATVAGNEYSDTITECVDVSDLELLGFITPDPVSFAYNVGGSIKIKVLLANRNHFTNYENVNITAQIVKYDSVINISTDRIDRMAVGDYEHEFANSYTVPNVTEYTIKVFIDKVDNYPLNDTIAMACHTTCCNNTTDYSRTSLSLGQNIPNPATESTRIDYKIPTNGEVVFHVYSIAEQIVYMETIEAAAGKNTWDFNTSSFASGIYYYSMTFKGEKLVKKMNVQR